MKVPKCVYILNGFTRIWHASVSSQNSHGKTELWNFGLDHDTNMGLFRLVEQSLLGNGTKLEMLRIDNVLYFVSE